MAEGRLNSIIRFKKGLDLIAEIKGTCSASLPLETIRQVLDAEKLLEAITGLRVHIFLDDEEEVS